MILTIFNLINLTFILLLQAAVAFLFGTLLFDILHYFMHQWIKSKQFFLRKIGQWHGYHHRFFTKKLTIETKWYKQNLRYHVLLEYIVQLIGILFCGLFLPSIAIIAAILFSTCLLISVWQSQGKDWHHTAYTHLPAYQGGIFVTANYHALHHAYPNNFFSGYLKLFDFIFGTGLQLAGKRIVMTGSHGALGRQMKRLLEKEGANVIGLTFGVDYDYQHYDQLKPLLETADILFLCHGTKHENTQQANCDSFVKLIQLFKTRPKKTLLPLEVWAVGSEIECHPCFGIKKLWAYADSKRNYAKFARRYYHDQSIQYRHLVHSAFTSPMGPGLMSAHVAAWLSLFLLKRGFRYVPVTYTGFAFLNYIRFVFAKSSSVP